MDSNPLQPCLFNFILYAKDESHILSLQDTVQRVIERFPCRILFIQGSSVPGDDFLNITRNKLTSNKEGISLCCDQIIIAATGKHTARVPFLILSNLMPDLPIYLLWGQDPTTDNEILPSLNRYADRLIFESDAVGKLPQFATRLLHQFNHPPHDIVDMNWARLCNWRKVFSHVFDVLPHLEQLLLSQHIDIIYNGRKREFCEHNDTQALYFQGWLAAQLGWTFKKLSRKEDKLLIVYTKDDRDITVLLTPQQDEFLAPGSLLAVEVTSHAYHHFSFRRLDQTRLIRVEITLPEMCELPFTVPLSNLERGLQFLKELFYEPPGEHYQYMLQAISKMKE